MELTCTKCNSSKVRSTDNESLYHPSETEVEHNIPNVDHELYVTMHCDGCGHDFKAVFNLTLKAKY